jgi:hypothetical protein
VSKSGFIVRGILALLLAMLDLLACLTILILIPYSAVLPLTTFALALAIPGAILTLTLPFTLRLAGQVLQMGNDPSVV